MRTTSLQLRPHSQSQSYRRTIVNSDGEPSGARAAGLERAKGRPMGSASSHSGCYANQPTIAVQASTQVQPSGR